VLSVGQVCQVLHHYLLVVLPELRFALSSCPDLAVVDGSNQVLDPAQLDDVSGRCIEECVPSL